MTEMGVPVEHIDADGSLTSHGAVMERLHDAQMSLLGGPIRPRARGAPSLPPPESNGGPAGDRRRVRVHGRTIPGGAQTRRRGVLLDVRQRRGVRGSEYAWANSQRLQQALAERGIGYQHLKELAPTSEIRAAQYAADAALGERKRTRTELSDDFKRAYVETDSGARRSGRLLAGFDDSATAALLCVERDPRACHRSLIAERLAADTACQSSTCVP